MNRSQTNPIHIGFLTVLFTKLADCLLYIGLMIMASIIIISSCDIANIISIDNTVLDVPFEYGAISLIASSLLYGLATFFIRRSY